MGDDLCWPDGYSWYYLKDHKILPTKRFYEKINTLFDKFIPEEGTGTPDPHQEGTGTPDPQNGAAGTRIPVLTSLAVCSVLGIIWWKWPYIRSWFCSKKLQQNPQVGPQPEDMRACADAMGEGHYIIAVRRPILPKPEPRRAVNARVRLMIFLMTILMMMSFMCLFFATFRAARAARRARQNAAQNQDGTELRVWYVLW